MARYYLAPYELRQSDEGSFFIPAGVEGPFHSIDLRPDPTRVDGVALVEVPTGAGQLTRRIADLGDDPDRPLPVGVRTILANALGLSLDRTKLRDILGELFITHARTDGTRWKPVQPNRLRGVYEVLLGAVRWEMRVVAGGATITEDWNTADQDSPDVDLNWTEVVGDWDVVSNKIRLISTAGAYSLRAEHDLDSADHYAQADVTWSATANRGGTAVRFAAAAETFYNGFGIANTDNAVIRKTVAGTPTDLASVARTIGAETLLVRTEVSGSSLKLFIAGVEVTSVTDTSITGNLRTGLYGTHPAGTTQEFDNFQAGDLVQTVNLARASETDAARVLTSLKTGTLARASEADSARALTSLKSQASARATETDTARPLGVTKTIGLGRATETTESRALTVTKSVAAGRATQTETAQALSLAKTASLTRASEVDAARAFVVEKTASLGRATETEAAQALSVSESDTIALGRATQTEEARSLAVAKTQALGRATETDTAQALSVTGQPEQPQAPSGGGRVEFTHDVVKHDAHEVRLLIEVFRGRSVIEVERPGSDVGIDFARGEAEIYVTAEARLLFSRKREAAEVWLSRSDTTETSTSRGKSEVEFRPWTDAELRQDAFELLSALALDEADPDEIVLVGALVS